MYSPNEVCYYDETFLKHWDSKFTKTNFQLNILEEDDEGDKRKLTRKKEKEKKGQGIIYYD